MSHKNYAALDIGSSKIVCLNAQMDYLSNLKITGIGHQISSGIGDNGSITDIKTLEKGIIATISSAEKTSNQAIDKVLININGNKTSSNIEKISIDISGNEVGKKDLTRITEIAFQKFSNIELEVIQVIPLYYQIDDIDFIQNPSYMCGRVLTAYLNIVTASKTALDNIKNCLARCHLDIIGILPSSYASALATLSREDMINGSILIDMGASNISVAIFLNGKMNYTVSLPFGGNLITKDIQQIFALDNKSAEKIKTLYASVFFGGKAGEIVDLFNIVKTDEDNYIEKNKLCQIANSRIREMLTLIKKQLSQTKNIESLYNRTKNNIILTGGAANLIGINELAKEVFNSNKTRTLTPKIMEDMPQEHKASQFACAYGLLQYFKSPNYSKNFKNFSKINTFLKKLKKITYYNKINDFLRKYF